MCFDHLIRDIDVLSTSGAAFEASEKAFNAHIAAQVKKQGRAKIVCLKQVFMKTMGGRSYVTVFPTEISTLCL